MVDFEEGAHAFSRTTHPDAQWFPQGHMGLFMHWGIHSVAGIQPSWAMIKDYGAGGDPRFHPPQKYFALAEQFDPQRYEPQRWLAAAAKAGFRYAVLTAKHHDGYALWPTKFGDFGTAQFLGGRDLVGPYVEACRNVGMKVGLYFSFPDWHRPGYPINDVDFDNNKRGQWPPVSQEEDDRQFDEFYRYTIGQVDELLTRYGTIDLMWFDNGAWKNRSTGQMRSVETIEHVRSLQPGIVVNNRWGKVGDYTTPECQFPETRPEGWWEACYATNGHWGYNPGSPLPDASWFIEMRDKCNNWGGNFLANVGPAPDGTMPEDFYSLCNDLSSLV